MSTLKLRQHVEGAQSSVVECQMCHVAGASKVNHNSALLWGVGDSPAPWVCVLFVLYGWLLSAFARVNIACNQPSVLRALA